VATRASQRMGVTKYVLYVLAIVYNLLLVIFPDLLPGRITDRVLLSVVLLTVTGLVFAFEEMKLDSKAFQEKAESHMLLNDLFCILRDIEDNGDELFYQQARMTLVQLEARLKRARYGELSLDNADTGGLGLELAKHVCKTLDATALWPEDTLPKAARAEYLERLRGAIASRRVEVRRLFILDRGMENSPDFIKRATQDFDNKVDVKYLYFEDWARMPEIPFPVDFGIWDKQRIWVYRPAHSKAPVERLATLYNDKASRGEYQKLFDANWEAGTYFAPPPAA
jgi:hypothetical protein